ncbi:hypothetical protein I314_04555 [Cryptococcus bacillisporus CA1873]|uniref:Uncharacterized protein n=1 Tax=Cryptococcus bacillisporus CA1873 TaxID=1296111 RepID=A0ABR5B7J7_CRYGA|nr:hypothetical protein I314_04555 [Cryptococcus bacillisporus CA1873]|eukprot:KIR59566.1 hypothetical protein I314_04555 [Cryptococcus gattii CA1873]
MGACHSRNHFTSPPSTPTSKSCFLASFPNPIIEVTDDRLPEFISTLHLESQRNRLQDISVAYKFNPNNQSILPPLVIKNDVYQRRSPLSFHSLRSKTTCSISSINNVSKGQQPHVMIVATPAQAVAPCLTPNEEMAYPRRMSVYTHIPTENVEPIPKPRGIRPLFLEEKYGALSRESIFKNINKEKTLAGCVAAQAEHVRDIESTMETAKAVCEIGLTDQTFIPPRERARSNSAPTIKTLSRRDSFKTNSFTARITSAFRRSSKPALPNIDIPLNANFVQQPATPQLQPLEFGAGFGDDLSIDQAAEFATDTVSSTVAVSTPDLVFSSLCSSLLSSASSASSLSVYSTDSCEESSPAISVVVIPPTESSFGSQAPSNVSEPPVVVTNTTPTESSFARPICYPEEAKSPTATTELAAGPSLLPTACGSRFIEMFV